MAIIKRQFNSSGNLVLQAVVDGDKIQSVRCFKEDGQEIHVEMELFEITENGDIQLKLVKKISQSIQKSNEKFMADNDQYNINRQQYNNDGLSRIAQQMRGDIIDLAINTRQAGNAMQNAAGAFGGSDNEVKNQEVNKEISSEWFEKEWP